MNEALIHQARELAERYRQFGERLETSPDDEIAVESFIAEANDAITDGTRWLEEFRQVIVTDPTEDDAASVREAFTNVVYWRQLTMFWVEDIAMAFLANTRPVLLSDAGVEALPPGQTQFMVDAIKLVEYIIQAMQGINDPDQIHDLLRTETEATAMMHGLAIMVAMAMQMLATASNQSLNERWQSFTSMLIRPQQTDTE